MDYRGKRCYQSPELGAQGCLWEQQALGRGKDKHLRILPPLTVKTFSFPLADLTWKPAGKKSSLWIYRLEQGRFRSRFGSKNKWPTQMVDVLRKLVQSPLYVPVSLPSHCYPSPASLVHSRHTDRLVFLKYSFAQWPLLLPHQAWTL